MHRRRARDVVTALGLTLLVASGCGDSPTGSGTGSVRISLAMTGAAPDGDGCRVDVDGAAGQVLLDGESVTVGGLSVGVHSVSISDIASNCSVQGNSSQLVSVGAGETVAVDFALDCPAPGSIEVRTRTIGSAMDPDGYAVVRDWVEYRSAGVNDAVGFSDLSAGPHSVELVGVAEGCGVLGQNPRHILLAEGETEQVDFDVACPPFFDHIAFVSHREGFYEIWLMNSDGSTQMNLTKHPGYDDMPAWAPDGRRLSFVSDRNGDLELYVMTLDGSAAERLTDSPGWDADPAWSPDGSRIAFSSDRGGSLEIFVMDADGSNPVNLTNHEALDRDPSWSPDGSRIAFYSDRDYPTTVGGAVYVMGADGSNPTRVTSDPFVGEPDWSPDGTQVAHYVELEGELGHEIFVVEVDGSNPVNLSNHPLGDYEPSWSPDGGRIAFSTDRGFHLAVFVMQRDGTNQLRLTYDEAGSFRPAWSPGQ